MMLQDYAKLPLVILDMQIAIDHPDWGIRNNPDAEDNIVLILSAWRKRGWPIIHVRHNSANPKSHYAPGQGGYAFKEDVAPLGDEAIVTKTVHSAFVEDGLRNALSKLGAKTLLLAGVKTNNSIEATVRHGSNLGYDIRLLADACFTHDQIDWNGKTWSAEDIHAIALSNLDGEYCTVDTVAAALGSIRNYP